MELSRREALIATGSGAAALSLFSNTAYSGSTDKKSQETLATAKAFMGAMGKGDTDTMAKLMSDDMVWHNEGDKNVPWIGPWKGKEEIFNFYKTFGENWQTTAWNTTDAFASGDTAAFFGTMNAKLKKTGKETGLFTFALRVKVKEGKVELWNWLEDSYAVSKAYNG